MPELLTSADDLAAALESGGYPDGGPVRLLDVRWRLDRPDGRPEYLEGHIPGAVYVDLDTELARHGDPAEGRHPLPEVEALQASARRWGISAGDTVVVYDDLKNLSSARAWWLLAHAGLEDVRVLDGSLRAWTDAGLPLATGEDGAISEGDVTLRYGALPALDLADVLDVARDGVLLDARAGERFRGEVEPIDPRAGHVPGAKSAPTTENVDAQGRFLDAAVLRERFDALGASPDQPVGVYCGSGITAAHEALALTLAGHSPALFSGSWSQWSNHPELPVATGD